MDTVNICPSCQKALPATAPRGLCPECLMKAGFGSGVAPEAGQPSQVPKFVPPPVAELARLFPQFEILELLGQGGMGAVYKARQPALDRLVALKILPPQTGGDPGFAERFTREARALARLNHPNIVAVYEFGRVDGLHFFVMEYVEGPNLRQLQQAGKLSPRDALQIVPQICEALQFAHDEGVVHRDIKPENVLLDRRGRVKIADFGLAKILGQEPRDLRLTGAKDVVGTPHYMAPEQIEHPQEVDHRADLYSLGVVFYEMLTGELPLGKFAAPSRKVLVDVRLDEVVLHTLEKEPERRYQQASQIKSDVETIAKSGAQYAGSEPAQGPRPPVAVPPTAEDASRQVKGPATGLVITGILHWLAIPFLVLLAWAIPLDSSARHIVQLVVPLTALALGTLIFLAGLKMRRLQTYKLALLGSILAIAATPLNLIGLPIGIWALLVLAQRQVRESFGQGYPLPPLQPRQSAPGGGGWKIAAVIVAAVLLFLAIPVGAILLSIVVPAWARSRQQARVQAASVLVRGTVTDALTGQPIAGAEVAHDSYGTGTRQVQTDTQGQYEIWVPATAHSLATSAPGYQTQRVTDRQKPAQIDFQLQPAEAGSPAASDESPRALDEAVSRGKEAWTRGDFSEALKFLRPAASQGHPVAQHRLGVMYVQGQGVEQSFEEATRWFRSAAEQGQGESQFSMGLRYLEGQSVAQDYQEAARWFKLAAEQGVGMAASVLAQLYANGHGVPKDLGEAYMWLSVAGDQIEPSRVSFNLRGELERKLSSVQQAEAQRRAREFVPKRTGPAD